LHCKHDARALQKTPKYIDNSCRGRKLVYKLYDLTPEEIKIVEEFNEGK
jgi:hypothetical protein